MTRAIVLSGLFLVVGGPAYAQNAAQLVEQGQKHYAQLRFKKAFKVLERARSRTKDPRILRRINELTGIISVIQRKPFDGFRSFWKAYRVDRAPLESASHPKADVKKMDACAQAWAGHEIEGFESYLGLAPDTDLNPVIFAQIVDLSWSCPSPPQPDPTSLAERADDFFAAPVEEAPPPKPLSSPSSAPSDDASSTEVEAVKVPESASRETNLRTGSYVSGGVAVAADAFGFMAV